MDEEMFLRAISKVIHNRTDSQFYRPGRSILLFKHFYPISNLRHRLSSLVSYNILTYVAAALKRGRCVCVCVEGKGGGQNTQPSDCISCQRVVHRWFKWWSVQRQSLTQTAGGQGSYQSLQQVATHCILKAGVTLAGLHCAIACTDRRRPIWNLNFIKMDPQRLVM